MGHLIKTELVKAELDENTMRIDSYSDGRPFDPYHEVRRIELSQAPKCSTSSNTVFIPDRTTNLVGHMKEILDPWPYHIMCRACGTVYDYFDCYTTTGENRKLKMRYCMRCGARVIE